MSKKLKGAKEIAEAMYDSFKANGLADAEIAAIIYEVSKIVMDKMDAAKKTSS